MNARLIVQISSAGERHVVFTRDPLTPTGELLLTAPGWENSTVTESRVLILGMDSTAIDALLDTELHSAETVHAPVPWGGAALDRKLNGEVR